MQAMVLVAGGCGIAMATHAGKHARIRIGIDRLGPGARAIADRFSHFATALFFLALLAGSVWIAFDLWNGHEASELVGIPWRVLRMFANLSLLACFAVSLRRAIAGDRK